MRKTFIYSIFLIFILLSGVLNWATMKDSILVSKVDEQFTFKGIIEEIKWQESEEAKYLVKVTRMEDGENTYNLNEKLMLKVIGEKHVELGDIIVFQGKTKQPMPNTNPKLFNYRLRLLSEKVYATMTIKDYSIVEINGENKAFKYRARRKFRNDIESLFDSSLNQANSSLMKSIVLGEYDYLEEEDISKYRDLGLSHILAVSGLHIGIIAIFLVFLLSNLGIMRKQVYLITLATIWFYGFLIGFPPSLLRANIMMGILFLAKSLAEPYDSMNGLFLSMFILLIINPFWIFQVGFQLSYLATFSIIYFTPRIQNLFYPYKNKQIYALAGILAVQIGLLPIQAYYFNEIPVLSILSNLFIAPILSLALILGAGMIGFYYTIPRFNLLLGPLLNALLNIQIKLLEALHSLPFNKINLHSPSLNEIIIYYIFILLIFKVINIKKLSFNIRKAIVYYLIFYIGLISISMFRDQSLEIHFIDVGQGDSILIRSQNGDYLIDTGGNLLGSFDVGENITLPYLRKNGVRRINGVFISHFHEDHSKSLPLLIDNLNIDNILISYENPSNESYNYILKRNIPLTILKENDRIFLDENTSMEVLSPSVEFASRKLEENDLSLVLLLRYYNRDILFTGDMEKEVENYLMDKFHKPIDIIKVPHHGSNTSSKAEFLNTARPKLAIITVGRNNLYGHPRQEVLDRYDDIGTEVFRTDTMGMVKLVLDEDDMKIEGFLKEKRDLYELFDDNILAVIYYTIYYLISYILIKLYIFTEEEELKVIGL